MLQLFVKPVGLPKRAGLRVVAAADGSNPEILGATQTSDRADPLFNDPIELWNDASGKEGSLPLVFSVKATAMAEEAGANSSSSSASAGADAEETLAVARISSSALRRFGLYNPREGAAVALPLLSLSGEPLPSKVALHCYVHVGYSVRRTKPNAQAGADSAQGPDLWRR